MKGFTLLEVLIVIAIFTVLVGLGLFMSLETFKGTMYRSEQATIVSMLQKARSRAMNNISQSPWGVCYIAPNYVIFKGSVCSVATAQDSIAANAGVASASNFAAKFPVVVFTQLSGTTTATTTVIVQDNRVSTTTINYEGTISW